MHGDHVLGLPGLIATMSMTSRTEPLHLYGPAELQLYLETHARYFTPPGFPLICHPLGSPLGSTIAGSTPAGDTHSGSTHQESPDCGLSAKATENPATTLIYQDNTLEVLSFPLSHRIPAWGFLFRERERPRHIRKDMIPFWQIPVAAIPAIKAGADFTTPEGTVIPNRDLTLPPHPPRSYAFCSDTTYIPGLAQTLRGVNLLYHESTFATAEQTRAEETFHSTAAQAACIARDAMAGQLLIGHFSARYRNTAPLLEEARTIFPDTIAAEDGMTLSIG
mgnify:FL=1